MIKIAIHNDYDYWIGIERNNSIFYNITKTGDKKPDSGYFDRKYITTIKKVPDLFGDEEKIFRLLTQ